MSNTHRTCTIHLGLGSKNDHSFRMLEYSENVLNNYNDKNYTHYNEKSHPQRPGIAYFDKHVQPSGDSCVGSILTNVIFILLRSKYMVNGSWKVFGEF
jgi:hypothetical protein